MKAPTSKAEQDVEEMLQSFRDSFAKTRSDAGGAAPPPPPPPQTAKPDMSKSGGGGSKWGDLKAGGKSESKASIPTPSFAPPPVPSPSTPRAYAPPPAAKKSAPPPVPSSSGARSSAGGSKWGALKEGVKEPTNAIERAKLVKEQEKAAAPPPPPRGVSAEEIDVVKPTGGGDSFTARIKAAQAAKAGSR